MDALHDSLDERRKTSAEELLARLGSYGDWLFATYGREDFLYEVRGHDFVEGCRLVFSLLGDQVGGDFDVSGWMFRLSVNGGKVSWVNRFSRVVRGLGKESTGTYVT